jgi:hypothetical protein
MGYIQIHGGATPTNTIRRTICKTYINQRMQSAFYGIISY